MIMCCRSDIWTPSRWGWTKLCQLFGKDFELKGKGRVHILMLTKRRLTYVSAVMKDYVFKYFIIFFN